MCGIVGATGKSKNIALSYAIITALLEETESRGSDATGYYAYNDDNTYNYFKLNVPATSFVRTAAWKDQQKYNFEHIIAHARMKTHGTELEAINNHPHISEDNLLAVVHNGIIMAYNSIANKNNINLLGECDSEILLKLVETIESTDEGVERIFKEMKHSMASMACLMVDLRKGHHFYAFRNSMNPICFIDLSQELGQYFFCSTEFIWKRALNKLNLDHLSKIPVQSVPAYEVWKIDENLKIEKFDMKEHQSLSMMSDDFPELNIRSWRERQLSGISSVDYMSDGNEDDEDQGPFGQEYDTTQEVDSKIAKIEEILHGISREMQARVFTKNRLSYESMSDELDIILAALGDILLEEGIDLDSDSI